MGLQKDFNKMNMNELNSKGITPSGGYGLAMHPLPSTSHFLVNFGQHPGQLQQSVRGYQAGAHQALKSLKGNDPQSSWQASLGLARFKRL